MRLFVGNGIGPLILASVAVAASTILSHAACMCDVSKDFNRILIFDAATGAAAAVSAKRKEDHCQFLISKRDDDDDDDDTDDENMPLGSLNPFRKEVHRAATTCGPNKEVLLFRRGRRSLFLSPSVPRTKGYPLLRFFLHDGRGTKNRSRKRGESPSTRPRRDVRVAAFARGGKRVFLGCVRFSDADIATFFVLRAFARDTSKKLRVKWAL